MSLSVHNNNFLYRMDVDHAIETPTGDSVDNRDNMSSGVSMSALPEEGMNTPNRNVSGANPTATLTTAAER